MHSLFIEKVNTLEAANEAYASAIIVKRKKPSSGKPGDKAIITKDGHIHGWIGGGCTRGIVLKEALLSIKNRKPRYVTISPDAKNTSCENNITYTMTCQSGGEVEVYIEPVLPKPQVVLFGTSHIALSLAKVAKAIDYKLDVFMTSPDSNVFPTADHIYSLQDFDLDKISSSAYVVVCTQGEGDAEALNKGLSIGSDYLAFVASRKKAQSIYTQLRREMGITFDQLKTIKTPAGLDIGAKTADEVAISILAEIIQHYRKTAEKEDDNPESEQIDIQNEDYYMNPVCNIPIQKSTAKHILEYQGEKVYFCCDGCKVSFEANPASYIK